MQIDELQLTIRDLQTEFGCGRESMLPVLTGLQNKYSHLSPLVLNEVARAFKMSITGVYSVASFYHFLKVEGQGVHVIHICKTIGCHLSGKDKIIGALEAELDVRTGETTKDGQFTLDYANCMGMCDRGPAMLVDGKLYDSLTPSRAVEIINSIRSTGRGQK